MADKTHIEWTDATWNPITGCSVISPGCANCYAMRLAGSRLAYHWSRQGLTADSKAGPVWTGEVRFNDEWLTQPLAWRRPRNIFVCAHGDLFHEAVPDAWIDKVFAVMALAPKHRFQVLTKRPERMRDYVSAFCAGERHVFGEARALGGSGVRLDEILPEGEGGNAPLPNLWLGVSVEDQARADDRIPILLDTPAAIRWISAEPLLGRIDLRNLQTMQFRGCERIDALSGVGMDLFGLKAREDLPRLDWVVVGGEDGDRPMHPSWARFIRDDCARAGVPFFFKQWGSWHPMGQTLASGAINYMDKGQRPGVWDPAPMSVRVGKKAAGRLLDGVTHDAMPAARP